MSVKRLVLAVALIIAATTVAMGGSAPPTEASASDPYVALYGPYSGQTHYTASQNPNLHAGGYGGFSWDWQGSCCSPGRDVYFNATSPDGEVTADVSSTYSLGGSICAPAAVGGCTAHSFTYSCGLSIEADIQVDGVTVGSMQALHFSSLNVSSSSNAVEPGTKLGVMGNTQSYSFKELDGSSGYDGAGETLVNPCFQDTLGDGLSHIHFSFRRGCWVKVFGDTPNKPLDDEDVLVVFRKSWSTAQKRECTSTELDAATAVEEEVERNWLAAGDVKGDGDDDLVHRHANGVNVWKSDGDGTYTVTSNGAPWTGYSFDNDRWLTPGDLNDDGDDDLAHWHTGGMNTWLSDGDGTFTVNGFVKPNPSYSMTSGEWLTPGDVDGNGDDDLVHRHANGVNVWKSDGDGTYTVNSNGPPWTGYSFTAGEWFTPGDVNGDGDADLIHRLDDKIKTWMSDGDGSFTVLNYDKPSPTYSMTSGEWLMAGNIDGDASGRDDLVHRHANGVNVWKSDGDGTYTVNSNGAPWSGYSFNNDRWLTPGDLNDDGDDDLAHWHSGGMNTWLSDGDGTFTVNGFTKPSPTYSMTSGEWLTPGDVNGNGDDDLVHRHANGINVWKSDGDGTYSVTGNGPPWTGYSFE